MGYYLRDFDCFLIAQLRPGQQLDCRLGPAADCVYVVDRMVPERTGRLGSMEGSGLGAIIYLASMAGINPALYEAAKVDGANKFRMIWHITLPGIRNVIVMMVILKLGHILDAGFEQIYLLYNISVYEVSDILDTWVFRTGLEQLNFSLAAAVGLFKSMIGLVLVLLSNQLAKKWGRAFGKQDIRPII